MKISRLKKLKSLISSVLKNEKALGGGAMCRTALCFSTNDVQNYNIFYFLFEKDLRTEFSILI
jgi:hypothetical protein